MQYQYLRIFLLSVERPKVLEASGSLEAILSRADYLRRIFSERIDFLHRGASYVYVPVGDVDWNEGPVILGRVGRVLQEVVNEPPEAGFAEIVLST